jgi:hypothetical protein
MADPGAAVAAGIMSTLSLPLIVAGDGLGALNVYSRAGVLAQPAARRPARPGVTPRW